jgi:WD repeat-containing protein 45
VQAHQGELSALTLNHEGTLLATASVKGQVIRIFSAENGHQIQELRRGTDAAQVFNLSFDLVSRYIGCTSDKGTVHLYTVRSDVSLEAMTQKQLSLANNAAATITPIPQPGQAALTDVVKQEAPQPTVITAGIHS